MAEFIVDDKIVTQFLPKTCGLRQATNINRLRALDSSVMLLCRDGLSADKRDRGRNTNMHI